MASPIGARPPRGVSKAMAADAAPEQVLVVPRSVLMEDPGWHGLRRPDRATGVGRRRFEATIARAGRFLPRPAMEVDRTWKQIIPYLVLRDGERYFLMRRTRGGADARLHDRWSIGVGGHLNPGDRDLEGGLRREWHEEVAAAFTPRFRFVGLLNDDTTEVGAVHVGAVFTADAAGRPVTVRESAKLEGSFVPAGAVREVADRLETWSAIVFQALESRARRARS